jgi:hypothetical protein
MEIVTTSGSTFAYPVYFARDFAINPEKAAAAEQQVQQWRDQRVLPFPDFPPAEKSALRGSIVYPPPESAMGSH